MGRHLIYPKAWGIDESFDRVKPDILVGVFPAAEAGGFSPSFPDAQEIGGVSQFEIEIVLFAAGPELDTP